MFDSKSRKTFREKLQLNIGWVLFWADFNLIWLISWKLKFYHFLCSHPSCLLKIATFASGASEWLNVYHWTSLQSTSHHYKSHQRQEPQPRTVSWQFPASVCTLQWVRLQKTLKLDNLISTSAFQLSIRCIIQHKCSSLSLAQLFVDTAFSHFSGLVLLLRWLSQAVLQYYVEVKKKWGLNLNKYWDSQQEIENIGLIMEALWCWTLPQF